MAQKTLAQYAGPAFAAPHPFAGDPIRQLNDPKGNGPFDFDATSAQLTHRVAFCLPWEGIGQFIQFALLATSSTPGTGGGAATITRNLPLLSPFASTFPNTYAVRVSGRGDGSDDNVTPTRPYSDAVVTVEFSTLPFDPGDGSQPFLSVSGGGSANFDTIPGATLSFSNGEPIAADWGVLVGQTSLRLTFHQVPDLPSALATLASVKGRVSSAALVLDGQSYPAGTLLYPTFSYEHTVSTSGAQTAELTVELLQRDVPWNSGVRSDATVDTITPQVYPTADLNVLLTGIA